MRLPPTFTLCSAFSPRLGRSPIGSTAGSSSACGYGGRFPIRPAAPTRSAAHRSTGLSWVVPSYSARWRRPDPRLQPRIVLPALDTVARTGSCGAPTSRRIPRCSWFAHGTPAGIPVPREVPKPTPLRRVRRSRIRFLRDASQLPESFFLHPQQRPSRWSSVASGHPSSRES